MIVQGTPEWFEARLGKVTASRITDVMAKGKGSAPSATRQSYLAQIVAERLSGRPQESYTNSSMQWGTETEPQARASYMLETGQSVTEMGFAPHPKIIMAGASPDGLVGSSGLIEIKCPNTSTHIETLLSGEAPAKYIKQMQFQMACTGRDWCDFVSFDPRIGEENALFIKRVQRDGDMIEEMEDAIETFLIEVNSIIQRLKQRNAA